MSPKKCPRKSPESVHEMSLLVSMRSHPLCPRDVCHPNFQPSFRNKFLKTVPNESSCWCTQSLSINQKCFAKNDQTAAAILLHQAVIQILRKVQWVDILDVLKSKIFVYFTEITPAPWTKYKYDYSCFYSLDEKFNAKFPTNNTGLWKYRGFHLYFFPFNFPFIYISI